MVPEEDSQKKKQEIQEKDLAEKSKEAQELKEKVQQLEKKLEDKRKDVKDAISEAERADRMRDEIRAQKELLQQSFEIADQHHKYEIEKLTKSLDANRNIAIHRVRMYIEDQSAKELREFKNKIKDYDANVSEEIKNIEDKWKQRFQDTMKEYTEKAQGTVSKQEVDRYKALLMEKDDAYAKLLVEGQTLEEVHEKLKDKLELARDKIARMSASGKATRRELYGLITKTKSKLAATEKSLREANDKLLNATNKQFMIQVDGIQKIVANTQEIQAEIDSLINQRQEARQEGVVLKQRLSDQKVAHKKELDNEIDEHERLSNAYTERNHKIVDMSIQLEKVTKERDELWKLLGLAAQEAEKTKKGINGTPPASDSDTESDDENNNNNSGYNTTEEIESDNDYDPWIDIRREDQLKNKTAEKIKKRYRKGSVEAPRSPIKANRDTKPVKVKDPKSTVVASSEDQYPAGRDLKKATQSIPAIPLGSPPRSRARKDLEKKGKKTKKPNGN
jgi:chromosome segregation ATPase